jgi:hypothetical protein
MSEAPPDQEPRPLHVLRAIAEASARLILKYDPLAGNIARSVPSDECDPAIQLLAGCYIELRDQVRALHDLVDQADPNDPIDRALARVGLARRPADWKGPGPRLVPTPLTPEQIAALSHEQLVALYHRVMRSALDFTKHETFIVRHWDGMDGCWTDCFCAVGRDEALRAWAERTNGGTIYVSYAEIDYYAIFPGGTHMLWDGSEGGEMHR